MRFVVLSSVLLLSAGCPDRSEVADTVGGAPKRQVDMAKQRLERASKASADRLGDALKEAERASE